MIYIIDDQIAYNSDDCTLSHLPTQETLSLSISSGRLFEQLLNSEGEILARETLLTEVWDKYGLRGSNSNLNQYLSILRRALAAYGCENLIITIPKIGIRLNTEIKIRHESSQAIVATQTQNYEMPVENNDAGQDSHAASCVSHKEDRAVEKSAVTIRTAQIALILMLFLGGAFWYFSSDSSAPKTASMSTIKLEGGCEAVIIPGLDVFGKKSVYKQLSEILKENNESCAPGRRIYFDKNTAFSTADYGRTTLSACNLDSSGNIVSCDNIYYLDWRTI